jgi:hypothetical protein
MSALRRTTLRWLVVLLLGACAGPSPDGPDDRGAVPDGATGRLSIALTGRDGLGAGLLAHLRVLPAGGTTLAAERESAVDPRGRWSEVVYLQQGVYDVLLDLLDEGGQPVWSGAESGVTVRPGELTLLDLTLDAAGGLQVVADIASGGDWFTIVGPQATNAAARLNVGASWNVSGFERRDPATGARRYYLSRCNSSNGNSLEIFGAPSPATYAQNNSAQIVLEGSVPGTWTNWCQKFYTVTALGDAVYLAYSDLGTVRILVSPAGFTDWRLAAVLVADRNSQVNSANGQIYYDVLWSCAFLIDDRFNLFCTVKEWHPGAKDYDWRIAHAFSPDGTVWSPFLPYVEVDGVKRLDAVGTLRTAAPNRYVRRLQAGLHGGVYHLWLFSVHGPGGADVGESLVHAVSTNRRDWSAFDEEVGIGAAAALSRDAPGDVRDPREVVVFRTESRWELVYRSSTSHYSLAVSE